MAIIIGAAIICAVVAVGVELCMRESATSPRAETPDKIRHYRTDM